MAIHRARRRPAARGFTLIEVLVALILVGISMTALVLTFIASTRLGVLSRRQANAMAMARSLASTLALADWTDARLVNANPANDAAFADPGGAFANEVLPSGSAAPDATLGVVNAFGESYETYANIRPDLDAAGVEQGRDFAVIVRYRVGTIWARAVALGYRYNPGPIGVGALPL